jgi:hypothetical protein
MKANLHFGGTYLLHHQGQTESQARNHHDAVSMISCLAYSSTLNIAVIYSTETSVYTHGATRSYIATSVSRSSAAAPVMFPCDFYTCFALCSDVRILGKILIICITINMKVQNVTCNIAICFCYMTGDATGHLQMIAMHSSLQRG